ARRIGFSIEPVDVLHQLAAAAALRKDVAPPPILRRTAVKDERDVTRRIEWRTGVVDGVDAHAERATHAIDVEIRAVASGAETGEPHAFRLRKRRDDTRVARRSQRRRLRLVSQ